MPHENGEPVHQVPVKPFVASALNRQAAAEVKDVPGKKGPRLFILAGSYDQRWDGCISIWIFAKSNRSPSN